MGRSIYYLKYDPHWYILHMSIDHFMKNQTNDPHYHYI